MSNPFCAGLRLALQCCRLRCSAGIVVDSSQQVFVFESAVHSGGDAIAAKTSVVDRPLQMLLVESCIVSSRSSAILVGHESRSDMTGLMFKDITVRCATCFCASLNQSGQASRLCKYIKQPDYCCRYVFVPRASYPGTQGTGSSLVQDDEPIQ
jgi:hypothetical protein